MFKKLYKIFSLCVFIMLFLSSCTTLDNFSKEFIHGDENARETIKIGVFEPMSGDDKEFGALEIKGIKLAHEMYPEALGRKVELVYGDNQSNMEVGQTVANELVEEGVSVILGSYGNVNSLVGSEIFTKAKIPAISITNTNPLVTSGSKYYFRVCLLDAFQGVALAKYATEELKLKTAAVMRPLGDDYAMTVADAFSKKFIQMTENEGAIVSLIDYNIEQEDYEEEFKRIEKSGAEMVFLPADAEEAGRIIKQAKEKGFKFLFMGTNIWQEEGFLQKAGYKASEGVCYSTIFDAETDTTSMSDDFLRAYKREYGDKEPESAVALGFDAYMLALDGINKARTYKSGEAIRDKIAQHVKFPGASGNITFDKNGDPFKSVVIMKIKDGKAKATYTMEPQIDYLGDGK